MGGLVVTVGLALGATAVAVAEPVVVAGETWQHTSRPPGDLFTRADGMIVELAPAASSCGALPRTAEADRYAWVPSAYWPKLDAAGGRVTLCLEHNGGAVTVTVTPAKGKTVVGDVAAILTALAGEVRPPTEVRAIGPIHPSRPVFMAVPNNLQFVLDGQPVGIGLLDVRPGTCASDHAVVVVKVGAVASGGFADGYWPTVIDGKDSRYGCLDLREGYLTVIVTPPAQVAAMSDVLAEIRRAAYARHGAPISSETDPLVLPHSQRRVSTRGITGSWKAVDGERFQRPGADVLASIAPLGPTSTMYSVAVSEGPCAPGDTALLPQLGTSLFPPQVGPVWLDDGPHKLRWTAWACVTDGRSGSTATLAVLATIAHHAAPTASEAARLETVLAAVARSYGVDIPEVVTPVAPAPYVPRGGYHSRRARFGGLVAGYLGLIQFAPEQGDRRLGALFGFDFRLQKAPAGLALAFDVELGYGAGELIGEVRTGVGLALGRFDAVVGFGAGSIGPAAALDVYGQASLTLPLGRPRLWLGALHAIGVGGPDHDQLDVHLVVPGRDDSGLFFGARASWFGDDGETMMDTGSALLFTFGGGAVSED